MEKGIIGIIGEYYAMCELMRNGYNPLKATSPGESGWDLFLLKSNLKVQVKAIDWDSKVGTSTNPTINIKNFNFDVLIIVLINYEGQKYRSLIIPKNKLRSKRDNERAILVDAGMNILHQNGSISLTRLNREENKIVFENYEDKWELFKS